jgi:RNA polymerase sigma-70 factor (ECF subfamily)
MLLATSTGRDSAAECAKPGFAEEALPYLEAVYRFAFRLSRGNAAEAEDLVQDTFLRAYRRWETYERGTHCLSWLFTICRHTAVRRGEGKARRMEHLATDLGVADVTLLPRSDLHPDGSELDPEGEFFDGMLDAEVARAIEHLPREYRDAVVLCDLQGYGYGEIAEILGVASGTIKSRIHRGRRRLQRELQGYATEIGFIREGAA